METKTRLATREDKAFIFSTWKKQLYLSLKDTYKLMDRETFNAHIEDMLETLFNCNTTKVITPADHDFQILGYICCSPRKHNIIFVYVKTIYRENGLMRKMVEDCFKDQPKFYSGLTMNKHFKSYAENNELEYLPVEFIL